MNAGATKCDLQQSSCTEKPSDEKDDMIVAKSAFATLLDWMVTEEKDRVAEAFKNCTEGLARVRIVVFVVFF